MSPALIVSIIFGTLSLILGGGLLRNYVTHREGQAVISHDLEQTKADVRDLKTDSVMLKTEVALINQTLERFEKSMAKLDLIETVSVKLDSLLHITENVLPRPEAEVRFQSVEDKVKKVEDELHRQS